MAERINFTKANLDAIDPPPPNPKGYTARVCVYDFKTPGLQFCVTSNGARSFYLYRRGVSGRPERNCLGQYPEMTIDQARRKAMTDSGKIASGVDPRADKRAAKAAMTLAELLAYYLDMHAKHHKKSWRADEQQFERYFGKPESKREPDDKPVPFPGWRNRKVNTIGELDVKSLHAKLGLAHGRYAANRLLAQLSAMFNVAKLPNPTKGVQRFKETERERFLHPDELPRFFKALKNEPNTLIRDFVLVCIFTGARRANVQSMAWVDLKMDRATWEIPDTKTGRLTIHLSPPAMAILRHRYATRTRSPYVFPGPGKSGHLMEPKNVWVEILKRAKIDDLRIHDLRRTLGSWQAIGGASLPIIGKSLGHQAGSPATAIYARLNLDPVKQSVDAATAAMSEFMPVGLLPNEKKKK